MVTPAPGLYVGTLRHRRHAPAAHQFTYSLFMALLDVDRIREAMAVSRWTGYNRRNWAAFYESDHLGDPVLPLRERLRKSATAAGVTLPDGPIYLLTHLRYAGYIFNPISLYYCYDRGGRLERVLADVRNTYGGRKDYWLAPHGDRARPLRAVAAKALYVSPFMDYGVNYEFALTPPGQTLIAHMNVVAPGGDRPAALFDATLTLEHRPWTAANLRSALLRHPLMTAKVIGAIHWEALRLRLKGVPVIPMPSGSS
jgi:uncharacterized protein